MTQNEIFYSCDQRRCSSSSWWQLSHNHHHHNWLSQVMNGGFGLVLDGSEAAGGRARSMLGWDVSNGVARSHNFYQKHHRYPHHQHSNHPHYDDHHPDHHHHVADVPGVATTMLKQQLGELWRINHCSGLSHISFSSSHLHP